VRHLIDGSSSNSTRNRHAICCGAHSSSSNSCTFAASTGSVTSFRRFGRRARRHAACSARHPRYPTRPPLRATSRLTVDGDRPIRRAISRNDSPARTPREISSRSTRDNHRPELVASNHDRPDNDTRCTVLREHPTRRATSPTGTAAANNSRINTRLEPTNGRPGNPHSRTPASLRSPR
jgi:hypothetical protein